MKTTVCALLLVIGVATITFAEESTVITPVKLKNLPAISSSPKALPFHAEGNVFFTDQPNDHIMKWSTDGKLSTFLQPAGRSNGLCFDKQGRLWACLDGKNELWVIDVVPGTHNVVVKDFQGKLLDGPNDVWVRPDGGVYFTDPFYKRDYWGCGPMEQDQQATYFFRLTASR